MRVALLLAGAALGFGIEWGAKEHGDLSAEFRKLRDNADEETRKTMDALDKKWATIGDLVEGKEKIGENGETWGGKNVDFSVFKDRWGAKDGKSPGQPAAAADRKAPSADKVQEAKALHEAAKRAHAELASKQVDEQGSRQSVDEHVQHLRSMEEWWCGSKHKPSPSQVCSVYEARIAGERPGLIEDTAAHAKELGEMHEVYCALPENAKAPPRPCLVWKSRHGAHSDL